LTFLLFLSNLSACSRYQTDEEIEYVDYDKVDNKPYPVEGITEFVNRLQNNIPYLKEHIDSNKNVVMVELIILKDGSIGSSKILSGLGNALDNTVHDEIIRSSNWEPGLSEGKPVNTRVIVPIRFESRKTVKPIDKYGKETIIPEDY
jgi:hypothetical protein